MQAAVFLDRDGTINEERGYISRFEDFRMYPFAPAAIERLNAAGLRVAVVSNQAAVARGIVPVEFVEELHRRLGRDVEAGGGRIDRVYYCPHHPDGVIPEFSRVCECRKPAIGMLLRAADDLGVDLRASYLVGDKLSDLEAAARAGSLPLLVRTGHGEDELGKIADPGGVRPAFVAADLAEAAAWIEADFCRSPGAGRRAGGTRADS